MKITSQKSLGFSEGLTPRLNLGLQHGEQANHLQPLNSKNNRANHIHSNLEDNQSRVGVAAMENYRKPVK